MNSKRESAPVEPYWQSLWQGYQQAGLPVKQLVKAREHASKEQRLNGAFQQILFGERKKSQRRWNDIPKGKNAVIVYPKK